MDTDQLHVMELLAYGDPMGVDLLARLAPLRAIEALEARGLLWVEQDRRRAQAHPAHPLYVEALRRRSPSLVARSRQRELAETIRQFGARRREDTLRIATWYLSTGGQVDPALLMNAARQASAAFDAPLAERLGRAALEAGGGAAAVDFLVGVLTLDGRAGEATELMGSASPPRQSQQPGDDQARAHLAMGRAISQFFALGQVREATALLAAAERTITEPTWLQQVIVTRGELLILGGELGSALRLIDRVLQAPASEPIEAQAVALRALAGGLAGRFGEAAASLERARELAARWQDALPWLGEVLGAAAYVIQAFAADLGGAAATAAQMHATAVEHGDFAFGIVLWCALRGQAARFLGQLDDARRWLREGLRRSGEGGLASLGSLCAAELAHVAAISGDQGLAQQSLAEAAARRRPAEAIIDLWVDVAATWVGACQGALVSGLADLLQSAPAVPVPLVVACGAVTTAVAWMERRRDARSTTAMALPPQGCRSGGAPFTVPAPAGSVVVPETSAPEPAGLLYVAAASPPRLIISPEDARLSDGESTVASFRSLFDQVRRLGQAISPATIVPLLIGHTHALQTMASHAAPPVQDRMLLAARFAEYTGWMTQEGEPVIGSSTVADPVAVVTGWCMQDLGRPREAVDILHRELGRIPDHAKRARVRYGARLALAYATLGEIDQACAVAGPVLDAAAQIGSGTVRIDLHDLARTLSRWHTHPAVRQVMPRLTAAPRATTGRADAPTVAWPARASSSGPS